MVTNDNILRNHDNQGNQKETMRYKLKVYENETETKTECDTYIRAS